MSRSSLVALCVLLVGAVGAVGCSVDNPQYNPGDGGDDAAVSVDLAGADLTGIDLASSDLAGSCGAVGAACMVGGVNGLCNGVCIACVDGTDDSACTLAYGSQASPYICQGGACVPGQCHTSADCSGGLCAGNLCTPCTATAQCVNDATYGVNAVCVLVSGTCVVGGCNNDNECAPALCGLRTPNRCETCLSDKECQNHVGTGGGGANTLCNPTTMACVANSCTIGATLPSKGCAGNAADICCAGNLSAGQTGTCQTGNCCQDSDCGAAGQKCIKPNGTGSNGVSGVCSSCDPINNNTYFVDPVNGDDSTGVGSATTGGGATAAPSCAFRTITRALQVATSGGSAVNIIVIGSGAGNNLPLATTEVYPVTVPARTVISIKAGTGNVTAKLPANATGGFILNGDGAAITGTATTIFTVDGQSTTVGGARGIIANGGFAGSLTYVHVQNLLGDGILVAPNATLTINAGTVVTKNGQPLSGINFQAGVHVTGRLTNAGALSGHLIINLPTLGTAAPIQLIGNQQMGLLVEGVGYATVTGELATKSVEISENALHNVVVFQLSRITSPNPGMYVNPNPNVRLDGVYISGSNATATPTTGSGIRVSAGSNFTLRRSRSLGNQQHGVHVTTGLAALGGAATNVFGIDLGETNGSTLQAGNAGGPNIGVGICVELAAASPVALQAHGENMSAGNCFTTAAALTHNANYACTGAKDIGYAVPGNPAATAVFSVTMCTP